MRVYKANVLSASNATSATGNSILADQYVQASFQATSGDTTLAGSIKVQASNDGINWSDISGASATISSGAPTLIAKIDLCYVYVRVVHTVTTAGTSTINVMMAACAV